VTPFPLDAFLERERSRVDEVLDRAVEEVGTGPVAAAARYALEAGGKRLRPILCVAAWRAVRGDPPDATYRLASALELIHTYSLMHDDLPSMDDDAVRRGRPATHVAHGVPAATIAGAALIPAAARVADSAAVDLGLHPRVRRDVVTALCRAAGAAGMVGGQMLDLEAEGRQLTVDELVRIHRLKTGALLAAAPVVGGRAAGADPAVQNALGVYGVSIGLAFQITDDILDVTGSTGVLGKTAGRDAALSKATFPALAGLDGAREWAVQEVETAGAALDAVGLRSEELRALAGYAVERDR
jgi:geranylgeranyl diphosphate synthase type II